VTPKRRVSRRWSRHVAIHIQRPRRDEAKRKVFTTYLTKQGRFRSQTIVKLQNDRNQVNIATRRHIPCCLTSHAENRGPPTKTRAPRSLEHRGSVPVDALACNADWQSLPALNAAPLLRPLVSPRRAETGRSRTCRSPTSRGARARRRRLGTRSPRRCSRCPARSGPSASHDC